MLLFVYGTLKQGGRLHHHMEGATFVCDDVVTNCNLYMLDWYPAVTQGLLEVQGQVYDIDDRLLRIMDQVEGEEHCIRESSEKQRMDTVFGCTSTWVTSAVTSLWRVASLMFRGATQGAHNYNRTLCSLHL